MPVVEFRIDDRLPTNSADWKVAARSDASVACTVTTSAAEVKGTIPATKDGGGDEGGDGGEGGGMFVQTGG